MKKETTFADFTRTDGQVAVIAQDKLTALPPPYDKPDKAPIRQLSPEQRQRLDASLDGVVALGLTPPASPEEEQAFVEKFLVGLEKTLSAEDNWTFLQPLAHTLEYCVKCQICSDDCPAYVSSGRQEIYRPTFRPEILRRIINKHLKKEHPLVSKFFGSDIDLNWQTLARLAELAYRCTLCRRCAQTCLLGCDNAVVTREIRKLFSQQFGIAPKELHEKGSVQQLKVGSTTGMTPHALRNILEFIEEEIEEKTGKKIRIPVDKKGADMLLFHNAGEFMAWPENLEAFAILLDAADVDWTLSSDIAGYDAVNYGVWYDDVQFARVALRQAQAAKDLRVRKISLGECGHAHKAMMVIADRILTGDLNIPRESILPLMEDLVLSGKIKLDPRRNNFPVTLHDPCNMVRLMGIVSPQRRILEKICPQFREMTPHGVRNYCCGGGSGFAITQSTNFPDWRSAVSGRMKMKQILEAFADQPGPEVKKYVCAPCSNCKGQFRDMFEYYGVWEKSGILYGGLVELVVNAMVDNKKPFIEWEWH
ncbi:MAG: (Fe-S)-binding protein [Smithellaceae bacterium]|nr:(Fe-S)-binding protein [Smithellaceae bacterium]